MKRSLCLRTKRGKKFDSCRWGLLTELDVQFAGIIAPASGHYFVALHVDWQPTRHHRDYIATPMMSMLRTWRRLQHRYGTRGAHFHRPPILSLWKVILQNCNKPAKAQFLCLIFQLHGHTVWKLCDCYLLIHLHVCLSLSLALSLSTYGNTVWKKGDTCSSKKFLR
jgi:hypothetical protein